MTDTTTTATTTTTARRPWQTPRNLLVAAGVIVLAQAAGWWSDQDGGLLLVARLFHHPLLFGVLVLALLTSALIIAVRSRVIRVLAGLAAGLALFLAVPVLLLTSLGGTEETTDEAAPGRTDRHLVVEEGSAMIDPLWWVYVDEGWGPAARRWQVGFFNGDVSSHGLTEASWAGPDRIRLVTGDVGVDARTHYIDLDPDTGRPLRTLTLG